ncbi:hypothetical protein [Maribacter flavus]|uniref:hypothetical protein n=1 Tax=Maribacter flavus TaxID=1658664 RepID=UPI00127971A1|nr:hypothetical protein [Maribacter flavus]
MEILKNFRGNSLKQLNKANANLFLFSKLCWDTLKEEQACTKAEEALISWRGKLERNNHFLTLPEATDCINELRSKTDFFDKKLNSSKYAVIKKAFIDVESTFKSFFVIGIGVPQSGIISFLKGLTNILGEKPRLFYFIERIEILKSYVPTVTLVENELPTIKILLDKERIVNISNPIISEILKLVIEVAEGYKLFNHSENFSKRVFPGISIRQGFGNYKHFLNLLGIIDEVYDYRNDHAFLKQK